jgi:aspartate/methionine/tyrosine aminotransferase
MKIAARMGGIAPFRVMEILARAKRLEAQGHDIVHMEIGEPDFPSTAAVVKAGRAMLQGGMVHYTAAEGLPQLRQAIADFYRRRFDVAIDPARIIITPGASGALQLVLGATVDPGDRVLMSDPGYPCNRHMVSMFGGVPVSLPVSEASGYAISPSMLAEQQHLPIRALMLASPANPTGNVMELDAIAALNAQLRMQADALLICDEIYQGLQYEGEAQTALALDADNLVVINSFSKFFGMTGWRVGWAVVPESLIEPMVRLAQNLFLAAPTPAQHAALASFERANLDELERRREIFRQRRDRLYEALADIGLGVGSRPAGAFYLYADVSQFTDDSQRFASDLLESVGVAVTPGADFGGFRADSHVRFAYTTDSARLIEGAERLRRFLRAGGD